MDLGILCFKIKKFWVLDYFIYMGEYYYGEEKKCGFYYRILF